MHSAYAVRKSDGAPTEVKVQNQLWGMALVLMLAFVREGPEEV